jgi:hypothetical protein
MCIFQLQFRDNYSTIFGEVLLLHQLVFMVNFVSCGGFSKKERCAQ